MAAALDAAFAEAGAAADAAIASTAALERAVDALKAAGRPSPSLDAASAAAAALARRADAAAAAMAGIEARLERVRRKAGEERAAAGAAPG